MDENKQLKNAGLKITTPRLKILQILENSTTHHLSAEDIYKTLLEMGEEISVATVYRVLTQFENAGLITKHNFTSEHSVFELMPTTHHDHLVCTKCGTIEEFVDEIIEKRQENIAKSAGFIISDHVLNIYGLCGNCTSDREC